MAHAGVLAQRYATGLLAVVRDTGKFRETAEELRAVVNLVEADSRVKSLMENPAFGAAERLSFLADLRAKMNLSDPVYGLLRLVIQKKRIAHLGEILEGYEGLYRKELGVVRATVSVAHEIGAEMQSKILEVVRKVTGNEPELTIRIDPTLIGGVKVQMGNTVLDATVRSKLRQLHEELLAAPREAA